MKYILLVILLYLAQGLSAQNKIDNLKSFEEIQDFVKTIRPAFKFANLNTMDFTSLDKLLGLPNAANNIIKEYQIDSNYYIRDFNNDGHKDLLIYGFEKHLTVFVILYENSAYKSYNLFYNELGENSIFPKVAPNQNLIQLFEIETIGHERMSNQGKPVKHVLTFHENEFVEYNSNPKDYTIDSIIVSMSCPWWRPYQYNFRINEHNTIGWEGNKSDEIHLLPHLDNLKWALIKKRLNYADFPSIKLPKYMISDNITYKITVFYDNGLIHSINNNHGYVNRSLNLIYKEIMSLKGILDEILKEKNKPKLPGLK
ncbi:hypothetical protein [Sphingobacterium composti Ten et al. 2007 non Yoo et al. 2007]|uniref:hypothetical protein n=1 Tax=Sphingobacterium composti TaxID=363260 RepID=UPI001359549C|nr:hypothetical protein [Sphingobacterium composti Ten et al. 2007 non Yoo et al. 2007]